MACLLGLIGTSAAPAAAAPTSTQADSAVAGVIGKIGRSVVRADKLSDAKVSTKVSCVTSSDTRFRCGYTIAITASPAGVSCKGIAYASLTSPIRVDPKAPKCVKLASPKHTIATLSIDAARKAITKWALTEAARQGLGTVMDAAAIDCTRQDAHAVRCTWSTDIVQEDGSSVQCNEPPAIAYVSGTSPVVHSAGSFDVTDCGGGGFNAG
jgi:hypothetical protein